MGNDDDRVKPSEQRGGTNVSDAESRAKGEWVASAADGIVPSELGGSDAPQSGDNPQYSDAALGETTGSDEPATEAGIDPAGGDAADATRDGGAERPEGAEPDLKDAPSGARAVDRESAR